MLHIEGLSVGYGRLEVLHDLSLELKEGARAVVLGANGAGKTTLCRAISGLIPARSGSIRVLGRDIASLSSAERVRLGVVQAPEGRQIFPNMTVLENLRLGGYVHGSPDPRELEEIYALFPILRERRDSRGGLLSGGEQQLLAIARAMLSRPRILLLDEPSQGLAPIAVRLVADAVNEIASRGITVLLVEQNMTLAQAVGEEAFILSSGRFIERGPVRSVLSAEKLTAAYLAT